MRVQTLIIVLALSFGLGLPCFGQNSATVQAPTIFKSSAHGKSNVSIGAAHSGTAQSGKASPVVSTQSTQTGSQNSVVPAVASDANKLLDSKAPQSVRLPVAIKTVMPVAHQQPVASEAAKSGNAPVASANASSQTPGAVQPAVVDGKQPSRVSQVVDLQPPAPTNRVPAQPVASASRGVQLQPLAPLSAPEAIPTMSTPTPDGGLLLLQPMMPRSGAPLSENYAGLQVPYEVLPMTKLTGTQSNTPPAPVSSAGKLSTEGMIAPVDDPTALFGKLHTTPVPAVEPLATVRSQPGQIPYGPDVYTWMTPTFYHKPLYFEQPNLERYGIGTYRWLQPAASSAHFFSSIVLMPYKTLTQHPCEHLYTLGYDRPGNCAAYQGRPLIGQSTVGEAFKVWNPYSGY